MKTMTLEQIEILIVRHLKHNTENDSVLKRLVGEYYALHKNYIDKDTIFNCLFDIIEKYDLLPHTQKGKHIRSFFIYKSGFWEPDFTDPWDAWIYRAKSCIRLSEVKKFPSYPEPAYFRNRHKN